MIKNHGIFFIGVIMLILLFSNVTYGNNINTFAQNSTSPNIPSNIAKSVGGSTGGGGIRITSPEKGSVVPINSNSPFIIKGISKDNATLNCKVAIIINNIKPYQPVQPMNTVGKEDYSTWQYTLSKNYTHITAGSNKITAKSYCLNNPQSSYYSTNVTGMNFTPEQLKNYNSPNQVPKNTVSNISSSSLANQVPKNKVSNISSSSLANQHLIAQQIKDSSQSSPPPCCITIGNSTSQTIKGVTPLVPLVADTTSHTTKHVKHTTNIHHTQHLKPVKVVKHDKTKKPVKVVKHDKTKKPVKVVKHDKTKKPVKVVKQMKVEKTKNNNNNNNNNNQDSKHSGKSSDLQNKIIDQVRHNLASAGIKTN